MQGQIVHYAGITGLAIGEDGQKYTVHEENIQLDRHSIRHTRKILSSATPEEPINIEFVPELSNSPKKKPIADCITFPEPQKWNPRYTTHGFWLRHKEQYQCSSCGKKHGSKSRFCPNCGVPMNIPSNNDGYVMTKTPNIMKHARINVFTKRVVEIAIEKLDKWLTNDLKNRCPHSPNLKVNIRPQLSIEPYIYSLSIQNIHDTDLNDTILQLIDESDITTLTQHANTSTIEISHEITPILIRSTCLPAEYDMRPELSDNMSIIFIGYSNGIVINH